jgi:hypothetical protein
MARWVAIRTRSRYLLGKEVDMHRQYVGIVGAKRRIVTVAVVKPLA